MKDKSSEQLGAFQQTVWQYYDSHGRSELPWRQPDKSGMFNPYHIMVSEVMLQQTQVNRVITKYNEFIYAFPTIQSLATAPLADVLRHWSGLGYNRRAKFIHEAAKILYTQHTSVMPKDTEALVALPGVGKNTAAAIAVYSFNVPEVFIETNIRTVFIHHFFHEATAISDAQILPLVAATLDTERPRLWYWALMDYGSHLKTALPNPNRQSRHYTKQSAFAGSTREVRGAVLKQLTEKPRSRKQLTQLINDKRLGVVLKSLEAEGLISKKTDAYYLGR